MFSMPSIFGAILIVAIKFGGYRYAGVWLNLSYVGLTRTNPNIFGVIRTILGLAAGSAFGYLMLELEIDRGMMWWYVLLLPLRFLEWLLVIWFFYERKVAQLHALRWCKFALFGTVWSYALDVIAAVVVLVTPGAVWVVC